MEKKSSKSSFKVSEVTGKILQISTLLHFWIFRNGLFLRWEVGRVLHTDSEFCILCAIKFHPSGSR